jgi:putative ABC transport system permease protein
MADKRGDQIMLDWKKEIQRELEQRLAALELSPAREAEIAEELAQHVEDRFRELVISGASEEDARCAVLAELSEHEKLQSELRRLESPVTREPVILGGQRRNVMGDLWQDLRFGFRMLAKKPGFSALATVTLTLGIGANTAMFSVVNAVLIKPLPFEDPNKLVLFYETQRPDGYSGLGAVCDADYPDWKSQSEAFGKIAAFQGSPLNLTGPGSPERVVGRAVDADLFPLLGVQPALGRGFQKDDEQVGSESVIVIGDGLWRRRFAADAKVLGQAVQIDGKRVTVVGVMPPGFDFPKETEAWVPLKLTSDCGNAFNQVIARLKPGVSLPQAQQEVGAIFRRISEHRGQGEALGEMSLTPLKEHLVSKTRPVLLILLGAVGFVLLIACANVANLLLVRAAGRQREISIRRALGASRGRIVRQLFTESLILAVIGGAGGVLLAIWGLRALAFLLPAQMPFTDKIGVDLWVLGFATLVSVASAILFGMVPALQVSKVSLSGSLRQADRSAIGGKGQQRVRGLLVVGEFATSIVLLIAAALLIQSFVRLVNVKPGFNAENLITMNVLLPDSRYQTPVAMKNFYQPTLERFQTTPGIQSAAIVFGLPFGDAGVRGGFSIEGQPEPPEGTAAHKLAVSPDYFRALEIPLLKGRAFDENDSEKNAPVLIISENFGRRFWPGEDPIGKRVQPGFRSKPLCTVVGVAADVKGNGLDKNAPLTIYMPYNQAPPFMLGLETFVARTDGNPATAINTLLAHVQAVDPELPVFHVRSMAQLVSKSIAEPRFNTVLIAIFAGLAFALAIVGIYGVVSYTVSERTREIGIRIALGANTRDVVRMIVSGGVRLSTAGVIAGVAGSLGLTRLLQDLLFEVKPGDPMTFIVIPVMLMVVALLASYVPARRATKVDPVVALRYE